MGTFYRQHLRSRVNMMTLTSFMAMARHQTMIVDSWLHHLRTWLHFLPQTAESRVESECGPETGMMRLDLHAIGQLAFRKR
jgi:hypothetical protein